MNVMHSDSSVIHIETNDGISITMFVETAAILYKKLGFVLTAIGHLKRTQNTVGLADTSNNSDYAAALRVEIAKLKADGFISVFADTDSILERLNASTHFA